MLKTLGIVEACFRSPAARARLSRRLGDQSVLEWVARRATDCQLLSGVIVVLFESDHRALANLVPADVPTFAARQPDLLGCLNAALAEYPAEAAVRIGAACPFVDPLLIDRLVTAAERHGPVDYVGYRSRDGRPAILSPAGVYAEWFRCEALRRAAQRASDPLDREQPTRFLYSHPEKFRVHLLPIPEQIDRDDVRLRIDMEEDFEHAMAIVDALGSEVDYVRIANLLHHQPALRSRMAAINRAIAAKR